MKNVRSILMLAVICTAASTIMAQGRMDKYEDELRSIYPKLDIALKAKDIKKLTAFYDDKYTLVSDGKTLVRFSAVDQWKSVLEFLQKVEKLETRIERVTNAGGKYSVDYTQASRGTVQFPESPVLPFTYDSKVTDTWVRDQKGVWKTISSVEHLSDVKVNGESAKPPNRQTNSSHLRTKERLRHHANI